ncbi:MAG: PhnD/SsuA/transferrin family substrate-binding protein, partial [Sulfuritalea sp.]|nr:PhnD/SsuA/transferrin family substrate-binding protein [Sulfuritalea sp.]
ALAVTDRHAALAVIGLRQLRDWGFAPGRDLRIVVAGSHANSLHRLLAGETAAAIVSATTLRQVEPTLAARVRILERLPTGLSAVVYHAAPRLAAQAPALTRALLDFAAAPLGRAFIDALGHEGLLSVRRGEMETLDGLVVEYYRQMAEE